MEVSPVLSCLMHSSAHSSAYNGRLITLTLTRTQAFQGHDHVMTSMTHINYTQQCRHDQAHMLCTATPEFCLRFGSLQCCLSSVKN